MYCFLYDANGKILEWHDGVVEWTNTSYYDTSTVGHILLDNTDTTAQDAFQHPSYYTVQNNVLTHKANVSDLQFQDASIVKESELDAAYAQATQTFKSNATGTMLTYLTEDGVTMSKFDAQYNYVNSTSYNGKSFRFFTLEQGGVDHTKDQFNQVWADGHGWMQTQFEKWDDKQKQRKACTTTNNQLSIITWNDTTVPVAPTGLIATAGTAQATLNWTANSEIDVQVGGGYNIYKAGTKINTSLVTTNSYTATNLTSGTAVTFTITAVDSDGNESPQSSAVTTTPN